MIFVGITDFNGQRYIAEVVTESLFSGETAEEHALKGIRDKITRSEPIDCTIVHQNSRADITAVFMGPVRLDVARDKEEA